MNYEQIKHKKCNEEMHFKVGFNKEQNMRIFICEELINNLESNINKIQNIQSKIDMANYEAYFIYTFALLESAFCEAIRHILSAFPEKINSEKQLPLSAKDIYTNVFSPQEIFETLVENETKKMSKGSAQKIVAEAESICAVQLSYDPKRLQSISAIRNQITHENTPSRQVNSNTKSKFRSENEKTENCKNDIAYLLYVLIEFSLKIKEMYSKYTKYKMLKEFWNTLFSTPLLRFEDCVFVREGIMWGTKRKVVGFNFDYIEKHLTPFLPVKNSFYQYCFNNTIKALMKDFSNSLIYRCWFQSRIRKRYIFFYM